MNNLLTDIPGVAVGHAADPALASGVTAVIFDRPAPASAAILGGAPGVRDTAMLEPEMSVSAVDALVLSGGSARFAPRRSSGAEQSQEAGWEGIHAANSEGPRRGPG